MKKHLFWLAALALSAAACTNDPEMGGGNSATDSDGNTQSNGLTTVKLASFASSQDRVVVEGTRADEDSSKPGSLTLLSSIKNLSKEGKIEGFVKEDTEDGRYMSATCVYYDITTGTYYTTYHMQGNNYNTQLENETTGFIETFKLKSTTSEDGKVVYVPELEEVVYSGEDGVDFDFNHLYFDDLNSSWGGSVTENPNTRIIAVGHNSKPSSKEGGQPNTAAIIGKLDLTNKKFDYVKVHTADKIYDMAGRVIDKVDAGDVNCVLRTDKYYYLATRKGVAALSAQDDNLFSPIHNLVKDEEGQTQIDENSIYFIKTPGSAKHLAHIYDNSHFALLYLADPNPETITANTASEARIAKFSIDTGSGTLCGANSSDAGTDGPAFLDSSTADIVNWSPRVNQSKLPENICPVDGKNVLAMAGQGSLVAACLGKGGLYVRNTDTYTETVKTFSDKKEGGSRPVNGVFVETYENLNGGRVVNGFIYVANGACLTILDAGTLEIVADYTAFDADAKENLASANYVHVVKTNESTNATSPDRIVTVAYGQAGVKVFKFVPPVKK